MSNEERNHNARLGISVSKDGRFSSMSKKQVESFDKSASTSESMTRRERHLWDCAGNLND